MGLKQSPSQQTDIWFVSLFLRFFSRMFLESLVRHNSRFSSGITEYCKVACKHIAPDLDNKIMVVDRTYYIQTK